MNNVTMHVIGIANSQQKTALKNALDTVKGVQSVDIDKTLGRIQVGYNEPADDTQIVNCVVESGYALL